MRTVVRLILVLVLSALVAACANVAPHSPSQSPDGQVPATAAPATAASPSGQKVVGVGQMQTDGGVQVAVTTVTLLQPGEYDTPTPGDAYLVVRVQLVNRSSINRDYNEANFTLLNAAGDEMYTTSVSSYTANAQLNYGTLAPGGKVAGDLIFVVLTADHRASLVWTPRFYDSTSYLWHVTY